MKHPHGFGVMLLLAIGISGGCSSSQMSRIDRNRHIYETWPIETKQAVLDGKVEPGMTPEMVQVAWGKPSEIVVQSSSGDEIWVYKSGGHDGSVYYPPGSYGGVGMGGPGIGISTGRGGTIVGTTGGIGVGAGGVHMGGGGLYPGTGMGPIITPPSPPDIREVVFRNGVVHRADNPLPR